MNIPAPCHPAACLSLPQIGTQVGTASASCEVTFLKFVKIYLFDNCRGVILIFQYQCLTSNRDSLDLIKGEMPSAGLLHKIPTRVLIIPLPIPTVHSQYYYDLKSKYQSELQVCCPKQPETRPIATLQI